MKIKKDLTSRNHKSGAMKMPAPFKMLKFDIMGQMFVWMLQSTEFQIALGTLNILDSPVRVLSANARGKATS